MAARRRRLIIRRCEPQADLVAQHAGRCIDRDMHSASQRDAHGRAVGRGDELVRDDAIFSGRFDPGVRYQGRRRRYHAAPAT